MSLDITQATPQSQIDTIALALVNRFFSEVDARTTVDTAKLSNAVQRASELARHTIFLLAQQVRKNNWETNKSLMERAIPVLQALIEIDSHKHYYYGQLGYAMKDRIKPEWEAAKANFDRAIDLLGDSDAGSWPFYEFNRAMCSIKLDPNFANAESSEAVGKKAIVQDLRTARRGLGEFSEMLGSRTTLTCASGCGSMACVWTDVAANRP